LATLNIDVLGGFASHVGTGDALEIKGRKTRALVAYLALKPGRACPREELVGLLWGDRGEEQARSSLRQSLSELRKALGETGDNVLIAGHDTVALDAKGVEVDAVTFERLADDGTPEALKAAVGLYRGDLLDGIAVHDRAFEDWLAGERGRLRGRACEALNSLLGHQVESGDAKAAIATACRLLALDPLQEVVHRALMSLYAGRGERTLALKQFQACRDALAAELGVSPEAETEALAEKIRTGTGETGEPVHPTPQPQMPRAEPLPLPDKPSAVVLPFRNLSGDPEQDYFAEGITQDIVTELARFGALQVVARHSAFELDPALEPVDASRRLRARYVVAGNVRKARDHVRITAQLIDGENGVHLWAERYDRELEDIFAVQDEVVRAIVSALGGQVEAADTGHALRKRPENLAAYDYFLRGVHHFDQYTRESIDAGYSLIEKAATLEPTFARAQALFGWFNAAKSWWDPNDPRHLDCALEYASKAVTLDPRDSTCWGLLASIHLYREEYDLAEHSMEQGIALNPNDLRVVEGYAELLSHVGRFEEALEIFQEVARFEPIPPIWYWELLGMTLFGLGRFAEAVDTFRRMSVLNYWTHAYLAACYGQLGEKDKAQEHLKAYAADAPAASLDAFAHAEGYFKNPEDLELWLDGLRKAGLPE
jgi:TolB-like protein/DNA-binding SARP family transcriptional activator